MIDVLKDAQTALDRAVGVAGEPWPEGEAAASNLRELISKLNSSGYLQRMSDAMRAVETTRKTHERPL